jgi:uncharacterized membrane protein YcfT
LANSAVKERVAWVDYSKGLCIIAVVSLYATMFLKDAEGSAGWLQWWADFARPFRMPDFFLIAGLFLARTIDSRWLVYADRKVLHFLYLFAVWTTIYFALGIVAGTETGHCWAYLKMWVDPFHMLWFIQILPVFFVITRLLKRVPWQVVLPAAALLQMVEVDPSWGQIANFCERYVYFYAGYRFAGIAFAWADWVGKNALAAFSLLALWAIVNQALVAQGVAAAPGVALVLGFAGAGAVIATGRLLSALSIARWLAWLGQNSVVVFLAYFIFTAAAGRVIDRLELPLDLGTRGLLATIAGVAGPVFLFQITRNTPARYLFARPKWARLPDLRPARAPQTSG